MDYAPLWVKSNFSFLEGASHPDELVQTAATLGLSAMAITDREGVYGIARAYMAAQKHPIKLLFGAQITVSHAGIARPIIALAQTRQGYGELCQILSRAHTRKPDPRVTLHVPLADLHATELIVLCPGPELLAPLVERFGDRLYALCTRHLHDTDAAHEASTRRAAANLNVPTVAGTEVLYHISQRSKLQDVLTCIRHGTNLSSASEHLRVNAEHALKSKLAFGHLFADVPADVARTLEVASRCPFTLGDIRYRYPGEELPSGQSESSWLAQLTLAGAHERYGEVIPSDVVAQIDKELGLIRELDYGGYFLTMWEIVQYCRRTHILCQGRGSAANSVVCFCLGITAIDPVRMELLFERFISRERAEPPDIDLDIEHNRREEVIQWVYARYGRRHAAMVANVVRYRLRSALREVGKALGLPQTALDRLAKVAGHYDNGLDAVALTHAGLDATARPVQLLQRLTGEILDFPRHLSIHPGGFLLGSEPVDTVVPIIPAAMENRTVIQWDKHDIDDLGLFKVDLLGLGALTQVHECFDLLAEHHGVNLSMATIPAGDAATYEMICRGDTVGVFQIESRAQMAMLPRLKPRTFYDLVIEVAIVRPGPIQGDMVHPYLRRRAGEEAESYPHPSLKVALKRTLGVPIFQEQVMKVAILAADYTPGEADKLRRDMAAWRQAGRIEEHHERLVSRMVAKGIPLEFAERVFSQIRGFGEYGFPESHAASFALIAYVTAWLRCHYPAAFGCALLNAQPMGFYSPATIVDDLKRHGVNVLPIDINHSGWDCSLDCGAIRMGLRYLKGFGKPEQALLLHATPPFASLAELVSRTRLPQKALLTLAAAGACASLGIHNRREAVWALRGLVATTDDAMAMPSSSKVSFSQLSRGESIVWDYRTSRHSTQGHPVACLRSELSRLGMPDAGGLNRLANNQRSTYVGLVICRQRPQTASGVTFFTLEDETGFVNLVVWRQVFERHTLVAKTAVMLGVFGKVQRESDVVHLIAERLWDAGANVSSQSRDFR